MRADRRPPHLPGLDVVGRLAMASRATPDRAGRGHDALGVQAGEQLRDALVLEPDQRVGRQPDVVEEQLELALRADDLHRDLVHVKPGVSVGTTNSAGRRCPVLAVSAVRPTTSTASAWSTPEMHTFCPDSTQSLPSRRAVVVICVRVRAGVGLGDRERHGDRAVGDAGQPALLLLVGAELADDGAADGRGHHHHQQRAAGGRHLLHHQATARTCRRRRRRTPRAGSPR